MFMARAVENRQSQGRGLGVCGEGERVAALTRVVRVGLSRREDWSKTFRERRGELCKGVCQGGDPPEPGPHAEGRRS